MLCSLNIYIKKIAFRLEGKLLYLFTHTPINLFIYLSTYPSNYYIFFFYFSHLPIITPIFFTLIFFFHNYSSAFSPILYSLPVFLTFSSTCLSFYFSFSSFYPPFTFMDIPNSPSMYSISHFLTCRSSHLPFYLFLPSFSPFISTHLYSHLTSLPPTLYLPSYPST